jgi:two-component system, NarL family, response regulator NreC
VSLRILLADDHAIFRQGVKALLEREGFTVTGEVADGHAVIQKAAQQNPDVVVMDLAMPVLNGLDAAREITRTSPRTRIILLTMHTEDPYVARALKVGIRGYVLKSQAAEDLVQAIREVARGAIYLSPGVSEGVVEAYLAKRDLPPDPLTPREHQVLQLIVEGKTTKEVAAFLGISVKTAESHRMRIMSKLDVHETAGLVRYAIREKLVPP